MRVQNINFGGSVLKTSGQKSTGSQFSSFNHLQMNDSVDFSSTPTNSNKNGIKSSFGINFTGLGAVVMDKMAPNRSIANHGLSFIRNQYEILIKKFPEDIPYYKQVAADMGLRVGEEFRLYSVVGPAQFDSILKGASPTDFALNSDFSGIRNLTHQINLHNHTIASDGVLSAYKFLEQSAIYGDKIAEKFSGKKYIRAITDHDIMDGAQDALKIIAKNPYKYRNLKLVTGSEISVSHINPEDVKAPMNFELILYAANPFNKSFNGFLKNIRENRIEAAKSFIQEVNGMHPGLKLNWEDAKAFTPNLGKGTSNGSLWLARDYAESGMKKTFGSVSENQIKELKTLRDKYLRSDSSMINPKITVTPKQVFDAHQKSGDKGLFGVAHGGFLQADMYSDKIAQYCSGRPDREPAHHLVWVLLNRLKQESKGSLKCWESNYQSYGKDADRIPWIKYGNKIAKELDLSEAGGVDCHTEYLHLKHYGSSDQKVIGFNLEGIAGVA